MVSKGTTETQTIHFQCTCGATYEFLFVPLTMISGKVFDVPNQEQIREEDNGFPPFCMREPSGFFL